MVGLQSKEIEMGMLGSYDTHYYCDSCNKFAEESSTQTASESRRDMRLRGWTFKKDGTIRCPNCKKMDGLPEELQNGNQWKFHG